MTKHQCEWEITWTEPDGIPDAAICGAPAECELVEYDVDGNGESFWFCEEHWPMVEEID